ncbi:hypothetical protein D3C80_1435550 [compost metagenome]
MDAVRYIGRQTQCGPEKTGPFQTDTRFIVAVNPVCQFQAAIGLPEFTDIIRLSRVTGSDQRKVVYAKADVVQDFCRCNGIYIPRAG